MKRRGFSDDDHREWARLDWTLEAVRSGAEGAAVACIPIVVTFYLQGAVNAPGALLKAVGLFPLCVLFAYVMADVQIDHRAAERRLDRERLQGCGP